MSTYIYSCLIDTSRKGVFSKSNIKGLKKVLNDAADALAAKLHDDEDANSYYEDEDEQYCLDSAVCGADNPNEIIKAVKNWKNYNDEELRNAMNRLEAKNKENENDSEALSDSLLKLCKEDWSYAYTLRDALRRLDGIFAINDDKCVIDAYGGVGSGCSKYDSDLVKKVTANPENYILMDVPYDD